MREPVSTGLFRRLRGSALALGIVVLIGSFGYYLVSGRHAALLDCVYMTVITITTVGYGEIIDMHHNPGGRVFTMVIALAGIGTATYLLSNFTAFIIEGDLSERFRRRQMENKARGLRDHFIVCGGGRVGSHIVEELRATRQPCVIIDSEDATLQALSRLFKDLVCLQGDVTDNDMLLTAGLDHARGLFAATDDDHQNLVVALTARQLNPRIHVVARCAEMKNAEKMRAAGANAVISPSLIGGLRMASEMLRPTAVSFLDTMLRDRERNLRIEEIATQRPSQTVADLQLERFPNTLLLAVRGDGGWTYNPKSGCVLEAGSRLIVMTTPEERMQLEIEFGPG